MKDQDFVSLLQEQAYKQSMLNTKRILPQKIDAITSFIGNNPWQVILFVSVVGAVIWQLWL
jgi:hypothetical protein